MITQDDRRQQQIIEHCGLTPNPSRIGEDAFLDELPFEIKSVTKNKGVSTARQVHLGKIDKWRSQFWVIAQGRNTPGGMDISELYIAHPHDLEPFFRDCECRIRATQAAGQYVLDRAQPFVSAAVYEKTRETLEVGSRLDDPAIPRRLFRSLTPLSLTPAIAQLQVRDFVKNRPLR